VSIGANLRGGWLLAGALPALLSSPPRRAGHPGLHQLTALALLLQLDVKRVVQLAELLDSGGSML
jgi:hypothetical protein